MKFKGIALFLSFILSLFMGSVSYAQTPSATNQTMTLEQCIEYALKNNIQIKQSELNTELSKVTLTQSKANLLPSLNANASHSYNIGRTIDRFTNQFADAQVLSQNFGVSTDVNLFNGFQNINTIQQNKFSYLAGKYDIEKMKNDISLNIATAYLQILFSMELLDNAKNQMGISAAQVDRTKILVDAGTIARGTLLDIQSQYALEELNVTNAQNQLDISYLNLAQLLNMPSAEGLAIVKPELNIGGDALLTATPTQIYNSAVSNLHRGRFRPKGGVMRKNYSLPKKEHSIYNTQRNFCGHSVWRALFLLRYLQLIYKFSCKSHLQFHLAPFFYLIHFLQVV